MKHRPLAIATLAVALLAVPAIPVFADSMGGWMDMSGQANTRTCEVRFMNVPEGMQAQYIGLRNGVPVETKTLLPKAVNMAAIAAALGNTPDCGRATVYGI